MILVDDDPDFRNGVAENLRDDGYRVLEYDAPEGMPPLATLVAPSVLLTDYQMPHEDGLTLARRFHAVHPKVPVVIATAYETQHLGAEAERLGFVHLVHKPIDYFTLRRTLRSLTAGAEGR